MWVFGSPAGTSGGFTCLLAYQTETASPSIFGQWTRPDDVMSDNAHLQRSKTQLTDDPKRRVVEGKRCAHIEAPRRGKHIMQNFHTANL